MSHGTEQTLSLRSEPSNAQASFAGHNVTTPATLTLSRRNLSWSVYRVTLAGYKPACAIVSCGTPKKVKVVNSVLLGLPWIVDGAAGSMRTCEDPPVIRLTQVRPTDVPYDLPPDATIIETFHGGTGPNICAAPYVFDPEFGKVADRIVVTTGNLSRNYEILGPLNYGIEGSDSYRASAVTIGNLGFAQGVRTFSQATPEVMNIVLQREALYRHGTAVDAVINVTYQTNPRNDVWATGLAIRFTDAAEAKSPK